MFRSVIVFYYVKFFLGYLYSFSPKKYFREYRVNGILLGIILCVLIYDATSPVFVNDLLKTVLDVDNPRMFSVVVEQVSFVILLIIEIGRASSFLPSMQMVGAETVRAVVRGAHTFRHGTPDAAENDGRRRKSAFCGRAFHGDIGQLRNRSFYGGHSHVFHSKGADHNNVPGTVRRAKHNNVRHFFPHTVQKKHRHKKPGFDKGFAGRAQFF